MKIVLVGDTQVGKTCLLTRLLSGQFDPNSPATVGAAYKTHMMQTPNGSITLQIWDTAGQEKFRALAPMYYRNAQAAILVFDLTNKSTFEALDAWCSELEEKGGNELSIYVVGNKVDLNDQRVIDSTTASNFVYSHGAIGYFETSAKTGENIVNLFQKIADDEILSNPEHLAPHSQDSALPPPTMGSSDCSC